MAERFAHLFQQHLDSITRAWVDEIYADRRTALPASLSYRELVEHLPDILDELAHVLDVAEDYRGIVESARGLRTHPQVRFQQGCLIDEVARELMILRDVLNDFLWREGVSATEGDLWELRDALRRTNGFVDELIAQVVLVYAASLRPSVRTRTMLWPPPRRRRQTLPPEEDESP